MFERFHGTAGFRYFALILFAVCFVEMVRRCVVHSKETREGKEQAKLEKMRESEQMGSQNWEKEE
ncbi:MAG: hypothetical protein IKV72_07845 [Firmicutes bacterium]|nr:hypothetical protein [Bacillota bacterium]MBR6501557.1 hypothetical protein [Bacillota bacterium]